MMYSSHVPVYTVCNANLAWIVQDHLLANGISARIEVDTWDARVGANTDVPVFSVCVPEDKAVMAKELADACEAAKIAGFLAT